MENAIDRILELSAEAHAARREAAADLATFHRLAGAILAYGKVLELLTGSHPNRQRGPETSLVVASPAPLPRAI